MTRRFTIDEVKCIVELVGAKLLSTEYFNYNTPINVICGNGHLCTSSLANITKDSYCVECGKQKISNALSFNYDYVKRYIEAQNITLFSKEYKNNSTHLDVQCNVCGKKWKATFANIKAGKGCPSCAGIEKLTHDFVKSEIERYGAKLISKNYINAKTKLHIECLCGQEMYKTFNLFKGHPLCKKCSLKRFTRTKYSIESVAKKIESMGGKLITQEYKSTVQKLEVVCLKCDRIFYPTFKTILKGHWCPFCNRPGAKGQKQLFEIVKKIYPQLKVIYEYKSNWLGRQHIDLFVKGIDLAIEYDGKQHFEPVRFGGISEIRAKETFEYTKDADKRKNEKIAGSKEVKCFVRIPYKEKLTIKNITNILKDAMTTGEK